MIMKKIRNYEMEILYKKCIKLKKNYFQNC